MSDREKQAGRLANEVKKLQSQTWTEKSAEAERDLKLQNLQLTRESVRYQFVIDILDVWIPATAIGFVNLNDGVLGVFGCVDFTTMASCSLNSPRWQYHHVRYGPASAVVRRGWEEVGVVALFLIYSWMYYLYLSAHIPSS